MTMRCDLCGEPKALLVRCVVETAVPVKPGGSRTAERLICAACIGALDRRTE